MNKVILIGRLTKDPELRYTSTDIPVVQFVLAVNRAFSRNGERQADFINCVAFGKSGEFTEKYFRQGMKVVVTGRIQNDNYTNREGQMVYSVQVMVDEQEFAESKNASGASDNGGGYTRPAAPSQPAPAGDGFMSIPDGIDDELPFS